MLSENELEWRIGTRKTGLPPVCPDELPRLEPAPLRAPEQGESEPNTDGLDDIVLLSDSVAVKEHFDSLPFYC
jgi:hypothetical protein